VNDGYALLRAILTDPADDTARLVYADWLDETGDFRNARHAELIRTEIEIARLRAANKLEEADDLLQKAWKIISKPQKLPQSFFAFDVGGPEAIAVGRFMGKRRPDGRNRIERMRYSWDDPGRDPLDWTKAYTDRGFLGRMECTAEYWVENADTILAAHPVQRVQLRGELLVDLAPNSYGRLVYCPTKEHASVYSIRLSGNHSRRHLGMLALQRKWPGVSFSWDFENPDHQIPDANG